MASNEIKNIMNCIADPEKSILSDIFKENKEANVQNLVMLNVLKFLVVS